MTFGGGVNKIKTHIITPTEEMNIVVAADNYDDQKTAAEYLVRALEDPIDPLMVDAYRESYRHISNASGKVETEFYSF